MDRKTLITGASGFIGAALSEKLKGKDLVLLNREEGAKTNILDPDIGRIFRGVDIVVHLAAIGNHASATPEDFMRVNSYGTLNLLEASKNNKVKKFIFASTGLVYGKPLTRPITEEHPIQPSSAYAISKAIAEINCSLYSKFFDVVIFRFSNVYGNTNTRSAVYRFLENLINKRRPIINGGEQKRDFVHISDVTDAISCSIDKDVEGTFNICYGKSYTIADVYKIAEKITGIRLKPDIIKTQDDSYEFSNLKAKKILGFRPKIDLEHGMEMIKRSF